MGRVALTDCLEQQAKEDQALMSQLLDQHNKLIDNLKKRDDIIQKKFNALDDRLGLSSFVDRFVTN